jgi:hypothetical protein
MHLLIPFASVLSEGGQHALRTLALPNLDALLARMSAASTDRGDAQSLTPPHERALARALGLSGADGELPWAAQSAADDGLDPCDLAWGLVTPTHWAAGADGVRVVDPQALALDEAESRALFDALHELFEHAGWLLAWGAPLRWYAAHESLAELPTASLDRAIGRDADAWFDRDDARMRALGRLQNEVQMLLHAHPVNAAREARGALPVNSFWLSGCGVRQPVERPAALRVDDRLRSPALAQDWPAWRAAWLALDAGALRDALAVLDAGRDLALTLCGERTALRLEPRPRTWWSRLARRPRSGAAIELLESL